MSTAAAIALGVVLGAILGGAVGMLIMLLVSTNRSEAAQDDASRNARCRAIRHNGERCRVAFVDGLCSVHSRKVME